MVAIKNKESFEYKSTVRNKFLNNIQYHMTTKYKYIHIVNAMKNNTAFPIDPFNKKAKPASYTCI